ncbi:MAG: GNAT family N-acetyltransferase [Prevotella sp.]|jgi:ribosomal protein S18 acetylase RimI-like enzyme|nr:GNAT family N-acetyltransferase [Prevotella sp.]
MSFSIIKAITEKDIANIKALFVEYQKELGFSLDFQSFDEELATLPGKYSFPKGSLYLLTVGEEVAGCIAMRPVNDEICEMKRLYIRPQYRGQKLARPLIEQIISDAKQKGYKKIVLDTLNSMKAAIALYQSHGFAETEPYYYNPIDSVVYFELNLP